MTSAEAPGWYGKLSALGDFASRRLPPDWVAACDQWLAECVAASRQQLGAAWLEVYLSAPVWRFAWGPGVADQNWWFGVLMPSCDKVGRYFPLVVAQPRAQPPADRAGLDHLEAWWSHLAQAAMATLAESASVDAFEGELQQAPAWPAATGLSPGVPVLGEGGRLRQDLPAGVSLNELARALAAGDLQQRLNRVSFWWPLSAEGGSAGYTLTAGLPQPEAFAEMLRGRW